MVIRISDKTQNYSKVTKLLVKPYDNATLVSDDMNKETFAPSNSNYNFEAISSGEDNLGHILLNITDGQAHPIW